MKTVRTLRSVLPSLKAASVALALACASHASFAGLASASLGGFRGLTATVTGGGVLNLFDGFGTYSATATNGPVSQSSSLDQFDWTTPVQQQAAAYPGATAQAVNVNGSTGDLAFDSAGVSANVSTSTTHLTGFGPANQASASATRQVLFNFLDELDFLNGIETSVAGVVNFSIDYALLASAADNTIDSAAANVLLVLGNLMNPGNTQTFFEELLASGSRNGTFTYTVALGAGDMGFLQMSASAISVSQIPEPSVLFLFGTGLVGLVLVRRRRDGSGAAAAA